MTLEASEFQRIAARVAERASELLCTPVLVTNEQQVVVASSDPARLGHAFAADDAITCEPCTRLSLHLDGHDGEVVVTEPGEHEATSPRLTQALIDLVVNQVTVVDRLPDKYQLKDKLIYDLLHGVGDPAALLREAKVLAMDLTTPRAVILIDAAEFILRPGPVVRDEPDSGAPRRRAQLIIGSTASFFQLPDDSICAYLGDGEIGVLKASNSSSLDPWVDVTDGVGQPSASWSNLTALKRAAEALLVRLRGDTRSTINIGVGRYHPGVRGLAASYQDARAALSLGRRVQGQDGVHCLDSLGIAAFVGVADEQTKLDLAAHLLSPLDHEPELIRTLDVFFAEDCCPSTTAGNLGIHRNTLSYRLDKVRSLTGLDPRRFDQAVQVRLALLLRSLR
ncbi:MAG TPA: helix-turn-helix domain-containing protein [Thermomicrobiales bacterium]|nr:helix-turn-helix domain-containing protein [Thermomicrobiales bacterium]